ncbi:Na+/H+ antiporter subunit A [Natribacillus halophilus]|uniref:Multisubunit sodium/proton antiporter, MrpA subunit n=1 Tax=Natribacillus halophilus TaxID=549003 RepID=A0A1G8JWN4_9BACI|nr:Na+/H+ antiporter subunit A [Natribacillus halophilus]SDI34990.1 multisubunit sodium/proton antiporter, MrpA subunit [Natribacillus halophilus]
MSFLHWAILIPFLFAIIVPMLYKYIRPVHTGWFILIVPSVLFVFFLPYINPVADGETFMETVPWVPSLGINFSAFIDGWSLLFALLITGIGALVVLYSIYYLDKKYEDLTNFYVHLLMFMGAMLGVVLSDNVIVLYVFWELTSISSTLLISYWYHRDASINGALKSLNITVLGGFAMLAGFALLYVMTGTFSIQEMIGQAGGVIDHPLFLPTIILILLGAFTKSAQFPFHIWLPDAMEAPTPVSAYLHSATMVKAGIYLVARFTPLFGGAPEWFWIIAGGGLLTLLWGSLSAIRQKDLKGLLAYSTVSQLGMVMCLLGLGSAALYFDDANELYTVAILAAVFHLFNHASFKGSLFMTAGIVDHETGTRDIRALGGLMLVMPATATISLIGAASMAGIPPLNGFLSKEHFFMAITDATEYGIFNMETAGMLFPVIGWLASVFTFVYCCIFFFKTFAGPFEPERFAKKVHEAPIGMLISPAVLGLVVVIVGIFPNLLSQSIIEPSMAAILQGLPTDAEAFTVDIEHWHGFDLELFMTIGVVGFGSLLYLAMGKWRKLSIYNKTTDPFSPVYDSGITGLLKGSRLITNVQMTGRLRDYLTFVSAFFLIITIWTMIRYDAFVIDTQNISEISTYEVVLVGLLVISMLALPFIQQRVAAIVVLGFVGFLIALFFVNFRAPDLALTQLLIETVLVILFMLAFYHLPEFRKEKMKASFKWSNALLSFGVGLMVTLIALSAFSYGQGHDFSPVSDYYIENSADLAGGYNMVNVVLVDFRALDTVLEVLVLGVAALAVVALIRLKMKEGDDI